MLVPSNDGAPPDRLDRRRWRRSRAILAPRGLVGLVEPLGFATSALRRKSEAVAAIDAVGGRDVFRLVHDTFHHHLAGEAALFPAATGLVHISGVDDPALAAAAMRDADRGLVTADDRIGNIAQIQALLRRRLRRLPLLRAVRAGGARAGRPGGGAAAEHGPDQGGRERGRLTVTARRGINIPQRPKADAGVPFRRATDDD